MDIVQKPKFRFGKIYNHNNSEYITLISFDNDWISWIDEGDKVALDPNGNMVAFMNERSDWVYSDNKGEEVSETYLELYEKYTDDEIDDISQIDENNRRPSIYEYTIHVKEKNILTELKDAV